MFYLIIKKYLNIIENINEESKSFILRQVKRMPSHYFIGLVIMVTFFYIFRLQPYKSSLMEKFFSSLHTIKSFES